MVDVIKAFFALFKQKLKEQKIKSFEKAMQKINEARAKLKQKAIALRDKRDALVGQ